MKRVLLSETIVADLQTASDFYDRLDPGLGGRCVASLLDDVERLSETSGIHPTIFGLHRALGSRFPFGMYYLNEAEAARVVAVLDLRRDPAWVRRELSRRNR